MNGKQRLELTWVGKEERPRLEPRILLEDTKRSYHAKARVTETDQFDNRVIFGDNLLALKALEAEFANQVKCIFIDPPYNTGAAFEQYDDGLEHSEWLTLIRDRIVGLRELLSTDGSVWMTIDDREAHYLKVVCDEVFGRDNFVGNAIWQKKYTVANDAKWLSENHDHILIYAKNKQLWRPYRLGRTDEMNERYRNPDGHEKGPWKATPLYAKRAGTEKEKAFTFTFRNGVTWSPPPGSSPRFPADKLRELDQNNEIWFGADGTASPSRKTFLRELTAEGPPSATIWPYDEVGSNHEAREEAKKFNSQEPFATPKPEKLLKRILDLATLPGDLVLDSFAGSGTTGAVAQKMGRRWIMIEQGEHCHTHILPRLQKVIDGEDLGGITDVAAWLGGGGFRYLHLAPSMLERDQFGNWIISKQYNPHMLAEAMCRHMGFNYDPSPSEAEYWRHGHSSERDFIFVTTQSLTHDQLKRISDDVGEDRTLLICCKAFKARLDAFPNLTVKKIPMSVLAKCEWGRDDYSMGVAALPPLEGTSSDQEKDEPEAEKPKRSRKARKAADEPGLFDDAGEEA